MKFELAARKLEEANVPCRLTETPMGFVIEFGSNWPEELVDVIYGLFPNFDGSMCGSSFGHKVISQAEICGGPQEYSFLRY